MQGTAYGLMTCFYNVALIVMPMVYGKIQVATEDDEYFGYYWVGISIIFIMGCSGTTLLVMTILSKTKYNNALDRPVDIDLPNSSE